MHALEALHIPPLLIVGAAVGIGLYAGKAVKHARLPSIIGFMIVGVAFGPSLLDLLHESFQQDLRFLTDVALGFVAVSIGLELSFSSLKKQGTGIIVAIFAESFFAFGLVTVLLYLATGDFVLALIFGAIAPASAPAGTVAIIQEYRAKGPLTKALYAVVGFDDGLGIIIFGFAAAVAKSLLSAEMGVDSGGIVEMILVPIKEVGLSLLVGTVLAFLFSLLARKLSSPREVFILLFAGVLVSAGLSETLHLSLILTNMIVGIFVVNTQTRSLVERIGNELTAFMPLLFILFFILAGANLHINALPALGVVGLVYIIGRAGGLMSGAFVGSALGRLPPVIRKYLGLGILSQAGVAIGLALIVKTEFVDFGDHGAMIGRSVITTVTATSIFFEIIGPILTKIALEKAGEISTPNKN